MTAIDAGVDTVEALARRLGELHRRHGVLLRACGFVLSELDAADSTSVKDVRKRAVRARAVLSDAVKEVAR